MRLSSFVEWCKILLTNSIHKSVVIRARIRKFSPDVVFLLVSAFEEFKILLEDPLESVDQNWSSLITVIKVLSFSRFHVCEHSVAAHLKLC